MLEVFEEQEGRHCDPQTATKEKETRSESDSKWKTKLMWVNFTLDDVENLMSVLNREVILHNLFFKGSSGCYFENRWQYKGCSRETI